MGHNKLVTRGDTKNEKTKKYYLMGKKKMRKKFLIKLSGTVGQGKRLEGIQIVLVDKNSGSPSDTIVRAFIKK